MGASTSVRNIPLALFQQNGDPPRILVLGCMGCGKSTLIRQFIKQNRSIALKNIYYVHTVQFNLLTVYRELRRICDDLNVDYSKYQNEFEVIIDFRHREDLSEKVVACLKTIQRAGLYEECTKKRRVLQLPINYNFFMQHTDRILHKNFVPTETDIFMSYAATIGLNYETIRIGPNRFDVCELPGHHIWRTRWKEFFKNISVLCFVVDLSELCHPAFYAGYLKDKTVGIYTDLVKSKCFVNTGFLLLFNKHDAFEEHAAGFDFRKLASHIRTPHEALSYYRSQFASASPKNRTYHHVVSLARTQDLARTIIDSLNKIFKRQRETQNLE